MSRLPGQLSLDRDDDNEIEDTAAVVLPAEPATVNLRLQRIMNGRWLNAWRRRGEQCLYPPLIEEIDQTGVDRHLIAEMIAPQMLRKIEDAARHERAHLMIQNCTDPSVAVLSYQHLLIQMLQQAVLVKQAQSPVPVFSSQPTRHWAVGDWSAPQKLDGE